MSEMEYFIPLLHVCVRVLAGFRVCVLACLRVSRIKFSLSVDKVRVYVL